MKPWNDFPTVPIAVDTAMFRIHRAKRHPAWFNSDGTWRFDPPSTHRDRFGVCYLGLSDLAAPLP